MIWLFDPSALMWALLFFSLVFAALSDVLNFTIPNGVPIAVVALFFPQMFLQGIEIWPLASSLASAGLLFVVGVLMFSRGLLGGGDVKLIAALGLWTGLGHLPRFLVVMAVAGGVLAFVTLASVLARSVAGKRYPIRLRALAHARIPYAVAIAVAGLDLIARHNRLF